MIRVRVLGTNIKRLDALDEDGYIDVKEGMTVKQLLTMLQVNPLVRWGKLYVVNYEKVDGQYVLKDDDVISLIIPIAGG